MLPFFTVIYFWFFPFINRSMKNFLYIWPKALTMESMISNRHKHAKHYNGHYGIGNKTM